MKYEYEDIYKNNRPSDRLVCCREGSFLYVLAHIGPELDSWSQEFELNSRYLGLPPTDGFWFWIGRVATVESWSESGWYTDDLEFIGEFVKITAKDFEYYSINRSWWDETLWLNGKEGSL